MFHGFPWLFRDTSAWMRFEYDRDAILDTCLFSPALKGQKRIMVEDQDLAVPKQLVFFNLVCVQFFTRKRSFALFCSFAPICELQKDVF